LAISELGRCLVRGLTYAGVGAVGKHFPGHGGVIEDTHLDEAIDSREVAEIMAQDVLPFKVLSSSLSGVMPSHVRYSKFDTQPACFSRQWLIDILRNDLNFQGLVFSDDLSMRAAELVGDVASRSRLAIDAGCDFILVCNNSEDADRALRSISDHRLNNDQQIMKKMFSTIDMPSFVNTRSDEYKASLSRIEST
jgi:beta-N-acetylhexosaminidase